ncbi:hypothetical protein H5410_064081 [Solanum commersonii]|uniref:Uncharacterized protein n=1 Tax=Solanum commersonii TaxID=4109 RepID=A0A9J5W196_SOLCO|nr:hypothetical protein H5410_064081 [Solanum commersonii]
MFVKTLSTELVGFHGQNNTFSRSNDPRIHGIFRDPEFRPHFCQNLTWTSVKTLSTEPVGTHGQDNPFSRSNDPLEQAMDFLEIQNSDIIFSKILPGHLLRHYLWSQLALTAKTDHFQGQAILETSKHPILSIFMCYSPWNFW